MISDFSPLWISLKTALVATLFAFILGNSVAYLMYNYKGKIKGLIDGILTLPLVLPPTVVGFLLLLIFGRNSPIGKLLEQFGLSLIFSWPGAVVAATVVAFPLMYKTVLGAYEQVEIDLLNAAKTLGASNYRIFWQIILPLAWRGVIAGTILSFARALGEFGATLMLAGSIPGRTQTVPIAIFFEAEAGNMQGALIWVTIMIAIALFVITFINYNSNTSPLSQHRFKSQWATWVGSWLLDHDGSYLSFPQTNQKGLVFNIKKNLAEFNLNVQFKTGHIPLGLLGASGSGKSLTLRCLTGLETPSQGQIVLNGRVLFDSEKQINLPSHQRRIGVVFQNYALFPHLTVAQNLAFGLQEIEKNERKERITYYLNLVDLGDLGNRYPSQLSGGQQQRVALARALAIQPEALLFDEPLSALDTYLRFRMEQLLVNTLKGYEGVTLFVTHKLEEAYRVCDRLIVLNQGKIIADGEKHTIFERPPNYMTAQVTECKNFSRIKVIEPQIIEALDWNCTLKVIESVDSSLTYLGFRAHHFIFPETAEDDNTFLCWLVKTSETQHRMTLFLRINSPPDGEDSYHVQAEIFKNKWKKLKSRPFPWYLSLDPARIILMNE
ncbi:MAG: molybdate ABC transporter permease subunit [Microcystaceae cyanobacterium]